MAPNADFQALYFSDAKMVRTGRRTLRIGIVGDFGDHRKLRDVEDFSEASKECGRFLNWYHKAGCVFENLIAVRG